MYARVSRCVPLVFACMIICVALLDDSRVAAQSSARFGMRRLDILMGRAVHLSAGDEGDVVALYPDGTAIHYELDGASRELILPFLITTPSLPENPGSTPNFYFAIKGRPYYQSSSPFIALFEAMPPIIPWDDRTANGELVRPWLLRIRPRWREWSPYVPRFGARPPQAEPLPFRLIACRGGGWIAGDGALLFARQDDERWRRIAHAMPGSRPSACVRDGLGELEIEWHADVDSNSRADAARHSDQRVGAAHSSCRASSDRGAHVYRWSAQDGVVSLSAGARNRWIPLVHIPEPAVLECARGLDGIFVASAEGLDFISPELDAERPDGLEEGLARRIAPVPRPVMSHSAIDSFIPERVQALLSFRSRDLSGAGQFSVGGPYISVRESERDRDRLDLTFDLQWTLDHALRPLDPHSPGFRELGDVPARLGWSAWVSAPTFVRGDNLRARARLDVYAALRDALAESEVP